MEPNPKAKLSGKHFKDKPANIHVLDIPTELLVCLLEFFDVSSRFSASRTCKLFSNIIRYVVGYGTINIRSTTWCSRLRGSPLLKNTKISLKLRKTTDDDLAYLTGVRSLELANSDYITKKGFKSIRGVRHLSISRCPRFKDSSLKRLAKHLKSISLHQVDTSDTTLWPRPDDALTDKGFKALAGVPKVSIPYSKVTDEALYVMAGVHTINLAGTSVTDKGIKALAGVHTIILNNCYGITDEGISALAGVHTIDLHDTKVSDSGISALAGVYDINLEFCQHITDKGVSSLAGVHVINLKKCREITDEGIVALAGVHTIDLEDTYVTDRGISALAGVHTINLGGTSVTDRGVMALSGVHSICLSNNEVITKESMKSLSSVHTLDLNETNVSDDWLIPLTRLKVLKFTKVTRFTVGCLKAIMDKGVTVFCKNRILTTIPRDEDKDICESSRGVVFYLNS